MESSVLAGILLRWYQNNPRPMPWLEARDPYKIWISEIILQQTRVAQGWTYYLRFTETFPDVFALHEAGEKEVLKAWEGLGYYTRARNLKKAAAVIVQQYKGKFPDTYDALLKLPGIGPYTAAAIAGFAFERPHAVIDGNVTRLITRLLCIQQPVETPDAKKQVFGFVNHAIQHALPSRFNQAIMNFGAMVCKPVNPLCSECPFGEICGAYARGVVADLPVRMPKPSKRMRYFHYFIVRDVKNEALALSIRKSSDIWKGLFEFPLVETSGEGRLTSAKIKKILKDWNLRAAFISEEVTITRQELSHQKIAFYFYPLDVQQSDNQIPAPFEWIPKEKVHELAMPVTLKNVLKERSNPFLGG